MIFACILINMAGITTVQAAAATVGYVDFKYLVDQYPETTQADKTLKEEQAELKKEYTEKSADLNEADKKELDHQLGKQLEEKRQNLLKAIADKVVVAINKVAQEKGLSVVLGKQEVICGGVDITQDVKKSFSK